MQAYTGQTIALSHSSLASHPLLPGTLLPGSARQYRIITLLHRTQQSTVYKASDLTSQRQVIIKQGMTDQPLAGQRDCTTSPIEHEKAMLDLLASAHIPAPRAIDMFRFKGHIYLVMTKIAGQTLEILRPAGQRDTALIINYVIDLCNILKLLHGLGYVHHDIKPANCIAQPDGTALLIDYGSSKPIRPTGSYCLSVTGTQGYMSLEQIRGEARPANDVFAMGTLLHNLVDAPDADLRIIIQRAIAPVKSRYQSVADMRHDLVRLQRRSTYIGHCSTLVHNLQPLLFRLAIFALGVLSLLIVRSSTPHDSSSMFIAPSPIPLAPILAHNSSAITLPELKLEQTSQIREPEDLVLDCYYRYQTSRIYAFATLDANRLDCVDPTGPLRQQIAAEIEYMHHQSQWRQISTHDLTLVRIALDEETAILIIEKSETRRDRPLICDVSSNGELCPVIHSVEHDRFRAMFTLRSTTNGWQIVGVETMNP